MKVKRIIEIEEYHIKELQEYCKGEHHGQLRFEIISSAFSSIAHSKPYNPAGDCISREALKEKLKERYYNDGLNIVTAIELIDNAQAIPLPNEQIAWEQGYEAGLAQGKHDRPQGEWIYHDKLDMYYCKDCGLLEPFTKGEIEEGIKLPNFCQQCGADMRGGA